MLRSGVNCSKVIDQIVRPMDITGKPMKGFVWVDSAATTGASLDSWIDLAARYVGSLPPK